MKSIILFFVMLFSTSQVFANPTVMIVSPRGETQMEAVFKEELQRLLPSKKFTFITMKPDTNNPLEMRALPELIRKRKPDLIYTWGTPTTVAVAGTLSQPMITDIPIVFTTVANPARSELVNASGVSNRNVTGVSHLPPLKDQLLAMQEYKKFRTVGVLYNPTEQNMLTFMEDLRGVISASGLKLVSLQVDLDPIDSHPIAKTIPSKIAQLKKMGAEWLYLGPDTFVAYTQRRLTTYAALDEDLPSFTANESAIRDGNALYGMFSPVENLAKFTAAKAADILSGKKTAGQIPAETLPKFVHVVNLCTANGIKLYPPLSVFKAGDIIFPESSPDDKKGCKSYN